MLLCRKSLATTLKRFWTHGPVHGQHERTWASVQVFNLHISTLCFVWLSGSRPSRPRWNGFRFCGWDSSCNTLDLGLEFSLVSFRRAGKTVGPSPWNSWVQWDIPWYTCGNRRCWPGHNGSTTLAPNSWVFAGIQQFGWSIFAIYIRLCVETVEAINFDCYDGISTEMKTCSATEDVIFQAGDAIFTGLFTVDVVVRIVVLKLILALMEFEMFWRFCFKWSETIKRCGAVNAVERLNGCVFWKAIQSTMTLLPLKSRLVERFVSSAAYPYRQATISTSDSA